MSKGQNYIAVDVGAESGRVMLGRLSGDSLVLEEAHRFPNKTVEEQGALHWDFAHLMAEIKIGIGRAAARESDIESIGVDTWGVDIGFLDGDGRLLENPYHYRDSLTQGMVEKACETLPRKTIYENTGIQFMQINSLYQLLALQSHRPELVDKAHHLLFIADLIMYHLTGRMGAEYTLASTSQMVDMSTGTWSDLLIDAFGLPRRILPDIIQPGTQAGRLLQQVAEEIGCDQIPVVAVGTHDTASAVAAVPVQGDRSWAYLSSGTWSLMGIELPEPIINDTSYALAYTNEGGVGNTIRLLKNIMGLWLVQESRRVWTEAVREFSYAELTTMASQAQPFGGFIDVDHPEFLSPGRMVEKINTFLSQSGQDSVTEKGPLVRFILESLAYRYSRVMTDLEGLVGHPIERLHIVGGGIQNELLCQLTANALGKSVHTGPVEATVAGNVLVQAMAGGQVESLSAGRSIVKESFPVKTFEPQDGPGWQAYKQRAGDVLAKSMK